MEGSFRLSKGEYVQQYFLSTKSVSFFAIQRYTGATGNGRTLAAIWFSKTEASRLLGSSYVPWSSSTGVTNCEFHAGRAEKILPQLLKSQEDEKLTVAVVNPARAGLRKEGGQLGCSHDVHHLYSHTRLRGSLWGSPEVASPPFLSSPEYCSAWTLE